MFKVFLLSIMFSINAHALIIIDFSNNFTTYSESVGSNSTNVYKDMINRFALSSALDNQGKFHFGFNVELMSRTYGTDTLSLTNMGPKFDWIFGNFFITGVWHPSSKGTRVVSGSTEKIAGWGLTGAFGYIKKITKKFSVGASFSYSSVKITGKTTSANIASDVTDSYTFIYPMLEFKLSFK